MSDAVVTPEQFANFFGATIETGTGECHYCNNPLTDGECIYCTSTLAIENGVKSLFPAGQIVELRAMKTDGTILSGLYTDHIRLTDDIRFLNSDATFKAIYTTLNPVRKSWLDAGEMAVNGYRRATKATKDADIDRRTWLLIDLDPVRPSNTSSTDSELAKAEELMLRVANYLNDQRWPRPFICESGNGMHLLYRIDLPNTSEVTTLIEFGLKALSLMFSTERVSVDTAVGNAARICKAYGTVARKGINDGSRPWRESAIRNFRMIDPATVSLSQLEALVATLPTPNKPKQANRSEGLHDDFDIDGFIEHFELDVIGEEDKANGSHYLYLAECPFKGGTHSGDVKKTALVVGNSLGFKCFSDDCADKGIGDFLKLMSEEHGRYPGKIWSRSATEEMDFSPDDPTLVEPDEALPDIVTPDGLTIPQELAPAALMPVAHVAEEFPDIPFTPEYVPKSRPYETPANVDDSRYPFPKEALYGWLGRKTLELDGPLGWTYPAMLTCWANQPINGHISRPSARPTLFTVLIAAPGVGKSVCMDRAMQTLPPPEPWLRETEVPGSEIGLFKYFKRPKDHPMMDTDYPDAALLVADEMKSILDKAGITGSGLPTALCSLFYHNHAGTSNKTGSHQCDIKLSLLGGLPAEDEAQFAEFFGSATTTGLHSRFLIGVGPSQWNWNHRWKAKPEFREPSRVHDGSDIAFDMTQAWVSEGAELKKAPRGRLAERAIRIAYISASANGDTEITKECMDAAMAFTRWQETIVETHTAGVAENLDGKIESAIIDNLKAMCVNGVSKWTNFWQLSNKKNWGKKFGSTNVTRVRDSLIYSGTLIPELRDVEEEFSRKNFLGRVRLRNDDGSDPEPAVKTPKKVTKRGAGRSISGTAPAMDDETGDIVFGQAL